MQSIGLEKRQAFYLVLSHPDRTWATNGAKRAQLIKICNEYDKYICILEKGANGDNPHYNVIVWPHKVQRDTARIRQRFTPYYEGQMPHQKTLTCKSVTEVINLLRYIHKETDFEVIQEKGVYEYFQIDPKGLHLAYHEFMGTEVKDFSKIEPTRVRRVYISKQSMLETIEQFMERHQMTANNYEEFIKVCVSMKKEGWVMNEVLTRPKHVYSQLQNNKDADREFERIMRVNGGLEQVPLFPCQDQYATI